jgi:hypothetical protein
MEVEVGDVFWQAARKNMRRKILRTLRHMDFLRF